MSVNIVHSDGSLEKIAGMGFGGGVPTGGTAGQVLAKASGTDYDTEWKTIYKFATMPSTADLFALPNNTVFETDGFWERIDGNGGKYLITTNYTSGALKLVNDGSTRYLVALNAVGAYERYIINPCRYGVRAIKGVAFKDLTLANSFAEENSAVFTNLIAPAMRAIYKFPAGEYVFKDPINIKNRQIGLKGEGCPNPKNGFTASNNANYTNTGTTLIFPFLNDGDIAIDTALTSISDIAIFGSVNSYDISIDRTKTITAPNEVVTETAVVQCTGIKAQGVNVSNVFVACFYKGIDGVGSNNYFNNIFLYKCHTGIHLGGDNKAVGVYAWLTHTCAETQGSLVSLIQLRVDSCVNAMRVISGKACTFEDIDGDYCTGSLIEFGDGTTWGDIIGCSFNNIHGRACALTSYDMTQDPDGIDVRDVPQTNNGGYGAIHVNIRVSFSKNSFIFNSTFGGSNPFDSASDYRTPDIGFTFENTTGLGTISENTFRYNASISNNEDLLKKIQVKDSTNYTLRVDAFNSTYYIEGVNVIVVAKPSNGKELIAKWSTFPTANASRLGWTIMYMGATNLATQKIHGYIYECVLDGSTYKWVQRDVQPGSAGKAVIIGDSYFDGDDNYNFANHLRSKHIYKEVVDYAEGGSGFGKTFTGHQTLYEKLQDTQMRADIANADVIYMHLGGNDLLSTLPSATHAVAEPDIYLRVQESLAEIYAINPNVTVYYIPALDFTSVKYTFINTAIAGEPVPIADVTLTKVEAFKVALLECIIEMAIKASDLKVFCLDTPSCYLVEEFGSDHLHPTPSAASSMFDAFINGNYIKTMLSHVINLGQTQDTLAIAMTVSPTFLQNFTTIIASLISKRRMSKTAVHIMGITVNSQSTDSVEFTEFNGLTLSNFGYATIIPFPDSPRMSFVMTSPSATDIDFDVTNVDLRPMNEAVVPTTDGAYKLKVEHVNGKLTFSWIAE